MKDAENFSETASFMASLFSRVSSNAEKVEFFMNEVFFRGPSRNIWEESLKTMDWKSIGGARKGRS